MLRSIQPFKSSKCIVLLNVQVNPRLFCYRALGKEREILGSFRGMSVCRALGAYQYVSLEKQSRLNSDADAGLAVPLNITAEGTRPLEDRRQ